MPKGWLYGWEGMATMGKQNPGRYHGIGVDWFDAVGACEGFSFWMSDVGVHAVFARWSESLVWLCVNHFRLGRGARSGGEGLYWRAGR
jgi:hypothetical protein